MRKQIIRDENHIVRTGSDEVTEVRRKHCVKLNSAKDNELLTLHLITLVENLLNQNHRF